MPQANLLEENNGVIIMDSLEALKEKVDNTRETLIIVKTIQEEDRKKHDERHQENKDWRKDHDSKHDDIMKQLMEVNDQTKSIPEFVPATPIDKNLLMKLGFGALFLLIALIFALTGNDLPAINDLTAVAGGGQ